MLKSMTAFARQAESASWGELTWEVKSVNHRYLELSFWLPESLRDLEETLRSMARQRLQRGKIDCRLRLQGQPAAEQLLLNEALLDQLADAANTIKQRVQHAGSVSTTALMQWPGVIHAATGDNSVLKEQVVKGFELTLQNLLASRGREGEQIQQMLLERLDKITAFINKVQPLIPQIITEQKQKLQDKLDALTQSVHQERLEQEMVFFAQRIDVAEELDRLGAHVNEVKRVLKAGGVCGRRLDFLMQELNREANTLASKSIAADVIQEAVELKVIIEQMREQIQNIE